MIEGGVDAYFGGQDIPIPNETVSGQDILRKIEIRKSDQDNHHKKSV
jgi:hypothetical protein